MSDQRYFEFEDVSNRIRTAKILVKKVTDETLIQVMGTLLYEKAGPLALILDFDRTKYLSTPSYTKLMQLDKLQKESGGLMICCNVRRNIFEVFEIINKVFVFADDLDKAMEIAKKRGFK